jgi:hypothetical protein
MVDAWTIHETPHVSIIAPNGNGKTYLELNGLLPALRDEQVVFLDVKGWDTEINRHRLRRIRRLPTRIERNWRDTAPYARHYVFRANDSVETAKLLEKCYAEGGWTIVLDEERAITDRHPSLGLNAQIEKYRLRGRGRVCLIAGTQAPRWVASSFYEQAHHLYIARIEDKRARRRLQEIGGNSEVIDSVVANLGRYEYLYIGPLQEDGRRIMEVTKVD